MFFPSAEYSCRESGLLDALVKQERAEIGGKKGKPRVVREGWGEFRVGENSVTFERFCQVRREATAGKLSHSFICGQRSSAIGTGLRLAHGWPLCR